MNITIQNYKQLRPNFDLTKLPKEAKEPFDLIDNDFDDFLELYTDSDSSFNDIRKGLDNHIKIVNKYLVDAPKIPAAKKKVEPKKKASKINPNIVEDARKPKLVIGAILVSRKINGTEITLVQKSATKVQFNIDGKAKAIGSYDEMIEKFNNHKKLLEKKPVGYIVVDERIIGKNRNIIIQNNNTTRSVVLNLKDANAYNRNSQIDLQKLWNLTDSQEKKKPISKETFKKKMVKVIDDKLKENKKPEDLYFLKTLWKGDKKYKASFVAEGGKITQTDKLIYAGRYNEASARRMAEIINNDLPEIVYKFEHVKTKKVLISSKATTPKKPIAKNPKAKNQKPKATEQSPCDEAIENYLENKKEARAKAYAKSKRAKIKNALDKESVNFYNAEFSLLRRFYNLVSKTTNVSFRSIQLLYMAYQKHSIARKVRKTSELAALYDICNKKLTKLFDAVSENKQAAKITFSDKELLEKLKTLVSNKKVDYAISLMNRVINIQGTAPDDKKVTRLISSIENAFKNGRVDERSRLYDDLVKAKRELNKYLDNKVEKIPTENYGLSGVKKKSVVATSKKTTNKIPEITLKGVVDVINKPPTNAINNVDDVVDVINKNTQTYINKGVLASTNHQQQKNNNVDESKNVVPKKATTIKKDKNVLSTSDIMNMEFDTLNFTGKWYDFMQSPAKNMRIAFQGKPKNGKTSGCMALANVLTNYGNVLYNFSDQGINKSTQDLWRLSGLSEKENAFISDTRDLKELDKLCASGNYDFVFIDMINTYIHRTGIKYFEFEDQFLKKYPKISFILVFEATKSGDFKGDQGWTHLVDAIVNVENYVLHNNGRYGVGEYVVWQEGLKKSNPKKYKEYFPENEVKEITLTNA